MFSIYDCWCLCQACSQALHSCPRPRLIWLLLRVLQQAPWTAIICSHQKAPQAKRAKTRPKELHGVAYFKVILVMEFSSLCFFISAWFDMIWWCFSSCFSYVLKLCWFRMEFSEGELVIVYSGSSDNFNTLIITLLNSKPIYIILYQCTQYPVQFMEERLLLRHWSWLSKCSEPRNCKQMVTAEIENSYSAFSSLDSFRSQSSKTSASQIWRT